MAQAAFHAISGVEGFVVAVGDKGKILHFHGDIYEATEPVSPTKCNLCAVHVQDTRTAWAVGDSGTVLRWDGRAWYPLALAGRHELTCVWGTDERGVWLGGCNALIQCAERGGGTLTRTDAIIVAIWGSGEDDVWLLSDQQWVLHWNGTTCASHELPAEDEDDEFYAIGGGAPDEPVWIAGAGGLLLRGDGEGWNRVDVGTEANLSGVLALSEDDVWVTTDSGQLRHWDGRAWRTEAFSAFGSLGGLCHVDGVVWACGERGVVLQHRPDDGGNKE